MILLSVTEYAKMLVVLHQAVLLQIKEKKLVKNSNNENSKHNTKTTWRQ